MEFDGKQIDPTSVQSFIDKLRDLKAITIRRLDSPLLYRNHGNVRRRETEEKCRFSNRQLFFAKRENEPAATS